MSTCCYTSFTYSYLARARVLAESLRRAHPDWPIYAILVDEPPRDADPTLLAETFDHVLRPADLAIPHLKTWLFKHDIVEACTAVKAHAMQRLMKSHDKVVYLDPDVALFHPLDDIEGLLDRASIVLTPHQTEPNRTRMAILDNEITSMRYGIYNLGFVAVRADEEGRRFAAWWADHLYRACYDDVPNGIFTDQKYCDLVPALFERVHVHRDPGYNVASWNLSNRHIRINQDGTIDVNGTPLRFYHFTKIGREGDVMVERYARTNLAVFEIWEWYRRQVVARTVSWIPEHYWKYATFTDGTPIPKAVRIFYRNRSDLIAAFDDPFDARPGGFLEWLRHEEPDLLAPPARAEAA